MRIALAISMSSWQHNAANPSGPVDVQIAGLSANPSFGITAEIGVALSVVVVGAAPTSYQWATLQAGDLPGATSPTYVPGTGDDAQNLFCKAQVQGVDIASQSYPVRHAPPIAAGLFADQIIGVNSGVHILDASSDFSGDQLSYALVANPLPAQISIDPNSGIISIDTDTSGAQSALQIVVEAVNSGGAVQGGFDLSIISSAALTDEFGDKTAAGEGGLAVTGSAVVSGDPLNHWQISGALISPSAAGAAAGLADGPYDLILDDGQALHLSIVPGYGVANYGELQAALKDSALAFGDHVVLRDGDYNASGATSSISRSAVAGGPYSISNTVKIRPAAGTTTHLIHHLRLAANCAGFDFDGLAFSTRKVAGSNYGGAAQVLTSTADLTFQNCTFLYGATPDGTETDITRGINAPGSLVVDRIRVLNNHFNGVVNAFSSLRGTDIIVDGNLVEHATDDDMQFNRGARMRIVGNVLTNKPEKLWSSDVVLIRSDGGSGMIIETADALPTGSSFENVVLDGAQIDASVLNHQWNYNSGFSRANNNTDLTVGAGSTRLTNTNYSALGQGWVSGGTLYWKNAHADAIQVYSNSANAGDYDDWVIEGNVILTGVSPAQRGFNNRNGGLFANGSGMGAFSKQNWSVKGNLIEVSGANGISVTNLSNGEVWSNVVLKRLGYVNANNITASKLYIGGSGTAYDNIANVLATGSFVSLNNITVAKANAGTYQAQFAAPPMGDFDLSLDYDLTSYFPALGATPFAGLAGWDFASKSYIGTR